MFPFNFKQFKSKYMKEEVANLYKDFKFIKNSDILYGKLPKFILEEIIGFTEKCRGFKNHPYGFLRAHNNEGQNKYQVSVPRPWLDVSYTLPYINYLGEHYVISKFNIENYERDLHRQLCLRTIKGHFDGYDFWVNYTYKGDVNPDHKHAGVFSSVIYVSNEDSIPTIFPSLGIEFIGSQGDIILFPSDLGHRVPEKTTDGERVTVSFNLIRYVE